jgi:hypothetical protein
MTDQLKPNVAMKMVLNGKEHIITFEELTLSNNLAQEALVSLLIKKQLIDGQELLDEINRIRKERYHTELEQ